LADKEELAESHYEKREVELENTNTCNLILQNLLCQSKYFPVCQPFISCRWEFTLSDN